MLLSTPGSRTTVRSPGVSFAKHALLCDIAPYPLAGGAYRRAEARQASGSLWCSAACAAYDDTALSQHSRRSLVRSCPLSSVIVRYRPYICFAPRGTLQCASPPPVLSPPASFHLALSHCASPLLLQQNPPFFCFCYWTKHYSCGKVCALHINFYFRSNLHETESYHCLFKQPPD